jgi:5'/3'-nucleotidase SurE
MIGQSVKPQYYRPSAKLFGDEDQGTTHATPSPSPEVEEWVLVDGTPASCVQIGLHHFFESRGPVDLVLSGPNYGRNTTAVFALSSGTLGGALEAAVCSFKAIALSFAFFNRNHEPAIIEAACRHAVRVVDAVWKQWPTDGTVDLYSVNIPLVEEVEKNKTLWTGILQNYWKHGSCFEVVEPEVGDKDIEEERIREGIDGELAAGGGAKSPSDRGTGGHKHKNFKWAPKFQDVYQSVEDAGPGSDGWAVKEKQTR